MLRELSTVKTIHRQVLYKILKIIYETLTVTWETTFQNL